MVIISDDGRKPLSVADKLTAPVEERAQAFSTFLAYGGTYTVAGEKVIHHVEVSSLQNWVGTDPVRFVNLQGDRLVLKSPPLPRGGALQSFEVVWERLR